ncbi:MAG: B12-binding domain-containing protein, partial [Deltaproteobacteria bacterium]|nr:B12-binding domain-containing protein [Deltaproteobacteria bacterium]
MENLIGSLGRAVMEGEPEVAEESAKAALRAGLDPIRALEEGLLTAIRKVGEGFGTGDVFLPELILAANACKAGASVL